MRGMGNADANEQFFAEERRRLVRAICETIEEMRGPLVHKEAVVYKVEQAAAQFEKETYDDTNERQR
jgi:hypothetical protein